MPPVTLLIVGAGERGFMYAGYAKRFPEAAKVVAVAEPREHRRSRLAAEHGIDPKNVFSDWRDAATRGRLADAVVIGTQDAMHADPAVTFAGLGYDMLLEKPMATTEADCRRVARAVEKARIIFALGHVLRYTAYTRRLKQIVDSGAIGEVVSIQHLEPVGYWHQAHAFVRGNWRNTRESSFMLLAKSCHDLDWIRHVMGAACRRVSSFGSLRHFRREFAPAGSADRCLDCSVEKTCPYSAMKIYIGQVRAGRKGWPASVLTDDLTEEGVTKVLRDGPYGRCVYRCDNDVVDNQVVNMEFDGGRTATFTMTAFHPGSDRKTRVFGTRGYLEGDGNIIRHSDFLTDKTEVIDVNVGADGTIKSGHGGGDYGLAQAFIEAVRDKDPRKILTGMAESLETHLMVFAAEQSRLERRVVEVVL
jgi:predicted dehydrogenase